MSGQVGAMVTNDSDRQWTGGAVLPHVSRLTRLLAFACLVALVAVAFASPAAAHDARPLSVDIEGQGAGLFLVRLRVPPTVEADNSPSLLWPENCRVLRHDLRRDALVPGESTLLSCTGSLEGRRIGIRYPLFNPSLSTLIRFSDKSGASVTQVLTPDRMEWEVPREPSRIEVASGYLRLGVEHIWKGWDHLLFVCGLLLLARTPRRVLLAITGFTLAHSLTLCLSTLGLVRLPLVPVEAAIALSIVFLAREIAWPDPAGFAQRFPIVVSSAFGLLHGFGFAAALREVGLPARELAIGLLSFNIGVEIGQVAFVACVVAVAAAVRKALLRASLGAAPLQGRLNALAAYALGIPASFWFFQRLDGFF